MNSIGAGACLASASATAPPRPPRQASRAALGAPRLEPRLADPHVRILGEREVRRGDRLILMLGNQGELWETILAAIKLGAVLIPASTLLGPLDLPLAQ